MKLPKDAAERLNDLERQPYVSRWDRERQREREQVDRAYRGLLAEAIVAAGLSVDRYVALMADADPLARDELETRLTQALLLGLSETDLAIAGSPLQLIRQADHRYRLVERNT